MGSKKLTKSTGRKATIYRSATCLNCGHPLDLSDIYCSYCSQLNSSKKPTLKDFFDELFSNIISYDSRFRKTLSVLVFRPGKITKEYVEGKRMTYANPFRFYLSISFLFFIIWGAIYNFNDVNFNDSDDLKELNNDGFVISKDGVKIEGDAALDSVFSNENSQSLALDSLIARSILKDSIKSYKDLYYSEEQLDTLNIFYGLDKR